MTISSDLSVLRLLLLLLLLLLLAMTMMIMTCRLDVHLASLPPSSADYTNIS